MKSAFLWRVRLVNYFTLHFLDLSQNSQNADFRTFFLLHLSLSLNKWETRLLTRATTPTKGEMKKGKLKRENFPTLVSELMRKTEEKK